jgi:hypothetical protein
VRVWDLSAPRKFQNDDEYLNEFRMVNIPSPVRSTKIAQPFMAGSGACHFQSPVRDERNSRPIFFRPCGTRMNLWDALPSAKALGYFQSISVCFSALPSRCALAKGFICGGATTRSLPLKMPSMVRIWILRYCWLPTDKISRVMPRIVFEAVL